MLLRVLIKLTHVETSLVVQWLRIHLPVQGMWVQSHIWEDPTCHGTTKPVHLNYWSPWAWGPCSTIRETTAVRSLCTATGEQPPLAAPREGLCIATKIHSSPKYNYGSSLIFFFSKQSPCWDVMQELCASTGLPWLWALPTTPPKSRMPTHTALLYHMGAGEFSSSSALVTTSSWKWRTNDSVSLYPSRGVSSALC